MYMFGKFSDAMYECNYDSVQAFFINYSSMHIILRKKNNNSDL